MHPLLTILILGTAAATAATGALAQARPAEPVRLLVPFAPGGSAGMIASTPAKFTAFKAAGFARWKQVIGAGKITAD
jgi:tripartite-type tricarboxylate transporter receptor subunit TctC